MTVTANTPIRPSQMTVKSTLSNSDLILGANTSNNWVANVVVLASKINNTAFISIPKYTVANTPSANVSGNNAGIIYCINGSNGNPCIAVSNGSAWVVAIVLGNTGLSAT